MNICPFKGFNLQNWVGFQSNFNWVGPQSNLLNVKGLLKNSIHGLFRFHAWNSLSPQPKFDIFNIFSGVKVLALGPGWHKSHQFGGCSWKVGWKPRLWAPRPNWWHYGLSDRKTVGHISIWRHLCNKKQLFWRLRLLSVVCFYFFSNPVSRTPWAINNQY